MLKKRFISVLLLAVCGIVATPVLFAQAAIGRINPRLGILPFTGGSDGDGETIATLLSFQPDIQNAFTVVPRTSAVNALVAEQNFQLSGYTDSDTIVRLGRLLNADFVVSGHIRRLGDRNLVITTIIHVETFELLAGDYREYRTIEEVRSMLPAIAQRMITAARQDVFNLPKLAIMPFHTAIPQFNVQDAEVLAQILAIEITNTGRFSVLPRITTMQAALQELEYQMQGHTAEEEAKALGRAINAQYVLSAEARHLGTINLFTAQILNVEDGSLLVGDSRDYRFVTDGIMLMPELALLLTNREELEAQVRVQRSTDSRQARLWSIGVGAGTYIADPWLTGTLRVTLAPLRYSFFALGFEAGMISGYEGVTDFYSLYPFAHLALFLPFARSGGWYLGAGGGYRMTQYMYDDVKIPREFFMADICMGFLLFDFLDISYSLQINLREFLQSEEFMGIGYKLQLGYVYRFK